MRVLVCGGRDFDDVPWMWAVLDRQARPEGRLLIDGAQERRDDRGRTVGADYWAHQWALSCNMPTLRFVADWHPVAKAWVDRSAGPKRNIRMLEEGKPDIVIAFPGGRGTAHMVGIAEAAGVRVIRPATPIPRSER